MKSSMQRKMETVKVEGNTFQVLEGGWKCECGVIIKREASLKSHVKTKSHEKGKAWRKQTGNTTIHVSLLTPNVVVYR